MANKERGEKIIVEDRSEKYFQDQRPGLHELSPDGLRLAIYDAIKDAYGVELEPIDLKILVNIYRDPKLDGAQTEAKLAQRFPELPNVADTIIEYIIKIIGADTDKQN